MVSMFQDVWNFLRERKKWWLMPIIIGLLILGTLIFVETGSALAPFIYTIF